MSGTRPDERRQTANISANGQNEVFNNQLIDGMDNNEREQFTILMRPSIDMIQEVKVDTNSYPAEVGRAGGAVVNLLTKSGTNDFHGGVYEYLRNDKLNANEFFSNSAGTPRPEYRQNQFGGSLGGAIQKDKTFFFGDYEGSENRSGQTHRSASRRRLCLKSRTRVISAISQVASSFRQANWIQWL